MFKELQKTFKKNNNYQQKGNLKSLIKKMKNIVQVIVKYRKIIIIMINSKQFFLKQINKKNSIFIMMVMKKINWINKLYIKIVII